MKENEQQRTLFFLLCCNFTFLSSLSRMFICLFTHFGTSDPFTISFSDSVSTCVSPLRLGLKKPITAAHRAPHTHACHTQLDNSHTPLTFLLLPASSRCRRDTWVAPRARRGDLRALLSPPWDTRLRPPCSERLAHEPKQEEKRNATRTPKLGFQNTSWNCNGFEQDLSHSFVITRSNKKFGKRSSESRRSKIALKILRKSAKRKTLGIDRVSTWLNSNQKPKEHEEGRASFPKNP